MDGNNFGDPPDFSCQTIILQIPLAAIFFLWRYAQIGKLKN